MNTIIESKKNEEKITIYASKYMTNYCRAGYEGEYGTRNKSIKNIAVFRPVYWSHLTEEDPNELYFSSKGIIGHYVYRGDMYFDIPSTPVGTDICEVILYLKYKNITNPMEKKFDFIIQDGWRSDFYTGPFRLGSCDNYHREYYNEGSIIKSLYTPEGCSFIITFNQIGRSWIKSGRTAKLCLRAQMDIKKTDWLLQKHFDDLDCYVTGNDRDNKPKLEITLKEGT